MAPMCIGVFKKEEEEKTEYAKENMHSSSLTDETVFQVFSKIGSQTTSLLILEIIPK